MAIIGAMQISGVSKIITDSEYCYKGATKWYKGWVKKNWKTATGTKVKNDDLWKQLVGLDPDRIEFQWVKAHATNEHNNYVDKLANDAATNQSSTTPNRDMLQKELAALDKRRAEILELLKE